MSGQALRCPKCNGPASRSFTLQKGDNAGKTAYGCVKPREQCDGVVWPDKVPQGFGGSNGKSGGQQSTALTRVEELPAALQRLTPITDVAALHKATQEMSQHAHLVTAAVQLDYIPPLHAVSTRVVSIDIEQDIYPVGGGNFGVKKPGMEKIARAAGLRWIRSERVGDKTSSHCVTWQAQAMVQELDGGWSELPPGSRTIDLREGGAAYEKIVDDAQQRLQKEREGRPVTRTEAEDEAQRAIQVARGFIDCNAETKAMLRCIARLGIRRSYTKAELSKPFVIFKLVLNLDMGDPDQKALALRQLEASSAALYGPPRQPEPRDVTPEPQSNTIDIDPKTGEYLGDMGPPPHEEQRASFTEANMSELQRECEMRGEDFQEIAGRLVQRFEVTRLGELPDLATCLEFLGWAVEPPPPADPTPNTISY